MRCHAPRGPAAVLAAALHGPGRPPGGRSMRMCWCGPDRLPPLPDLSPPVPPGVGVLSVALPAPPWGRRLVRDTTDFSDANSFTSNLLVV